VKFLWKADIDMDAERFFECDLEPSEVEETSMRRLVDQDVEVAAVGIFAVQHGPEYAWIAHTGLEDDPAYGFAVVG
jgi:hypothetical protein